MSTTVYLSGKVAVMTGSSSGMGLREATLVVAYDANVILADIPIDDGFLVT